MNSVEKRHSSRRNSGHWKQSDGGYSDTSSVGSFPDETDREVSNLTDRAFRSLCIGEEAVYNDSDLSASSPSARTERQQAFCQTGRGRDWKREDMKRAGQESYGLQLQQYGQEWVHGAETQGDPRLAGNVDGRTGGRVSATFQHALMDGSLHQRSLNKEPPSPLSNGAPEFSTQERRSRSRVSSLIKAFNSDGVRDGAGQDGKLKEWNNEANWDKSALMSIQRELSEISTTYGQNFNSAPFSPTGPYSSQESFYSSQVATAHMDASSSSSFMRSSHSQHSVSSLYSSSSNVFIHSEYSPFRVWQAHDRFPYQHGDVSGYMHCSDFQTWYETPLYKELSLGPETQHVPMHEQWGAEPPLRKPLEHVALPPAPRSSSTSTVQHKASAVQKRCESELAEFHTMRKRTQSLGTNKLPLQRPSPTNEMLRRGWDTTLNSITDLQQKFKTMTSDHSVTAEMTGNPHGVLHRNDSFIQFTNSNTATAMAGELVVGSNTWPTPFSTSQSHTPGIYAHQEVRTSEVNQCALSPPAMEHPPVRAESRGATPDIRLSSYKARATSLLFNLKDNRKRVKSTYSPPKFQGLENFDRNKQVIKNDVIEPRDTVINIPEFQDSDLHVPQGVMQQGPSVDPHTTSHHPLTGYHSPGVTAFNPYLTAAYEVQHNDHISGDYLPPPIQSEMFPHTGFNSYSQDEYPSSPLAHGHIQQQEYVSSFANNMHANNMSKTRTLVGHAYRQENANKLSISNTINMVASPQPETIYSATDVPRLHVDYTNQTAYQMNTASAKQYFKESMRGELTHVDRYEQVKDNKYAFTDLSSKDWKHHCRDKETPCVIDKLNAQLPTEAPPLTENDPNAQFYQKLDMLPDMSLSPPQKYGSSKDWNMSSTKAQDNLVFDESKAEGFPVYPQKDSFHTPYHTSVNPYLSNQPNQVQQYSACSTQSTPGGTAANEKQLHRTLQEYRFHNQQDGIKEIQSTEKYPQISGTEQEHMKQKSYGHDDHDNYMFTQESSQIQQDIEVLEKANKLKDQQDNVKQHYELNLKEKTSTADQMQCIAKPPFLKNQDQEIQHVNVKEKPKGKINEKQLIQTELSKQLDWAQTLQTKFESVRAGLTEELVTCRATEGQTEQTTERILVGGQPHVKQTITDKLKVVQSKGVNIKEEEDKQVRTQQAVDQGMKKSQHNKDDRTMVELKERSTAGEAEVEVAQKECIETIRISPDGKAKGEVLAWRELGAEQAKKGQKQAGTSPAGVIKMKQSEQVQIVTGALVDHLKAQLSKTGMEKAKLPKMDETKAVHIKVDDDIKEKGKDELLRAEKINADPSKVEKVKDPFRTKPAQAEKAKVKIEEKAKEELNKVLTARDKQTSAEQGRAVKPEKCGIGPARIEHAKIEHAKEKREQAKAISEKRMEHSVESLLIRKAEKDKLKQEPDQVEKVKTELAKAKLELATIKEKMREEQKEKQNKAIVAKAVDKNVLQKEKQPPPYQQTEETPVIVLVDKYERVREKYGLSETALTNRKLTSANNVTSPSQDMERSRPHSAKGEEASDNSKPRDAENSQSKAATEDKAKSPSVKDEEVRENQYVYSETSKEFKLSNPNDSSSSLVTKLKLSMDSEIGIDKNTKDKVINAKPEPVSSNIDVSQPGVSNINPTKSLTHERKQNPNKDTHSTTSRTLTHKERTQTKQEILTSKIKAHAEKEISAIKEKHFASGKSVQQRLPSQEVTKPLDKNIPHSVGQRDQQATAQVKTYIPNSVTTPPVMSSNATTSLLDSQVQKQEPFKSVQDTVVQQPMALNLTKNNDNRNEELKQRENTSGTKATSQIKEQNPISLGKEEAMKVNFLCQAAGDINTPQKTKADLPPSKPEESSQNETPQTSDVAMWETQEHPEGAPLIQLVFCQNEAPANDDSLQIMGIMVTVRAKTETVGINDEDGGAIKEALEKAKIDSEINDNIKPSGNLCLETSKENIAPDIYNGRAEEEKQFVLASQPTVGIVHTKVGANNHPENEPEETTYRLENSMADLTDKRLTTQKESSLMRKTSNSQAVHQEDPVADKEYSSTVMKPAPNKPGKTQPILFKQGKITEKAKIYTNKNSNEAKSNIKGNVEVGSDPSLAKATETGFNSQMSFLKSDIKSSKMQSRPPSEKYQMADHVTSTDNVQDGGSVPLLADKRTHSSLPEADPQNKNSTSLDLKGLENVHRSIGKEGARTPSEENNQEEGNVHIGSIAIRVVPGVIVQDNQEKAGKELVAIQSLAETMNTERNTDRALPLTPAIKPFTENVVQPVQHMPHYACSSGSGNQSSKVTDSSETKRDEDETHQQSKMAAATAVVANSTMVHATEEEYFQFQGVTEINPERNNAMLDSAGMQGLPKEHTEELGVPRTSTSGDVTGLHSDKTSLKSELSSQQKAKQVTNEDKVLDNTSKTTMESDSATSENMSKSDQSGQHSNNSCIFPERQSNQRVHIETGEDVLILKQASQNTFHASGKEKQGVKDSSTTKNSRVSASKEQPNYKQEAKSKPRVSTIPEISAIADYARLKVIAADDEPDTIQEFPPNKKEGFFPMIQSRHSRRPVFTAETPERQTVSKKTVLKEPELSHKMNKEPKCLAFSTMEQDHKRTGMFKLREKENVHSDVKTKDKADDKMRTQDPTGTPQAVPEDFKYLSHDTASVAGPMLISSANINQTNTYFSQYSAHPDNSTTTERPEGGEVFTEQRTVPQMDNNSHQQDMFGKMFNREQNKGERSNAIVNEAKSKENEEEIAAKQRQENTLIQQINEERRATLETQKREERRAREREARAARIEEERRETQREAEKIAEEERTAQLLKEKAAQEEIEKKKQETKAAEEERIKKRREEKRRKKETEERIAAQIQEEMRRAKQREEERHAREEEARVVKEVEDKKRDKRREEDRRVAQIQEERRAAQIEEERREREEEMARREEERRAKHREIEQRIKEHEEMRAAKLEEERMKRKQEEAHRQEERQGEIREEGNLPAPIEADQPSQKVEHEEQQPFQQVEIEGEQPSPQMDQRKPSLLTDALQYYAITSSANSKDKHIRSPVSPQRRVEPTKQESTLDESLSGPQAPSSPAPVSPRSTTSSPAPGPKPTMFRVKDNTLRASSLTKSVKPRLHKSFGEDLRVGSPLGERRGSDRAEEERDRARRSAGTPIHQDTVTRSYRLPVVKESPPAQPQPPSFVPEPRAVRAEYRPYSRRSMAPDEEDSRSCVSNMSEDVESFATGVGDLADFRGFCDYDRPESACSFSSNVARSLGKPPSVPPKTDKALRRAQRLTTRRIKKEFTKTSEEGPVPVENPLHSASSSSSSELRSSYCHAQASPHFSAPFSLTHAPASASSVPSSHAEMPSAYRYSHASPHAIGSVTTPHATGPVTSPRATLPVSTPIASPHAPAPISLPVPSPHVPAPAYLPVTSPHRPRAASLPVAPKTIASTPSSPVLCRHVNPTGPVKQYHVEPGYTQSYPLTQPKVLQDPGSGQYYVVDMPVEVQTKTFFDPETGKYVQLNVRQAAHQPAAYPQSRIPQPQLHVQALPQVYPQVATPGKSFVVYPGYPPGRQSMPVSTLPPQRSCSEMSIPDTLPHPLQSDREGQNDGYHGYNSEETPYMDTAYETDTICDTNKVNHGPYEKYPEADTNSHLQEGSLVYENDTSAQSSLQQRDIITMSELEDFMDVSDW